jgi:hypothetical protein
MMWLSANLGFDVERDIARGYYTADEAVRLFTRAAAAE